MAHTSVSPQTANLKDGDNERHEADLEEGELEEGELEEAEQNVASAPAEEQSAPKPTPAITTPVPVKKDKVKEPPPIRSSSKRRPLHHHHHAERSKDGSEPEEEWAGVVEKAIKRALAKDSQNEKTEGVQQAASSDKQSDEDRKYKRKKRKKKHRDDGDEEEEERKDSKKRKRSHRWDSDSMEGAPEEQLHEGEEEEEEEEEDDDEMLFVRGASPITRTGYVDDDGPPSPKFMDNPYSFNDQGMPYDSYNEEESDYDSRDDFSRCNMSACDDDGPKRGMGRGVKRRPRGMGRLMQHSKRQGRKETKSKRGGSKRQQMRSNHERGSDCICMFYMQGKCQKGDDCPYSHNALPPRKMELCKFYLMDCCAKKDKCLYMHHDFPCKFYHTGLKCFSGPRCKFSHGHLSDSMRAVLLKHLETAPKEILGDFPRLSREGAAAMVYNKKNRGNKTKKIPSLFEIEVPIPAQLLEQKEASEDNSPNRRTPMPESDNEDQERPASPVNLSPKKDTKSSSKTKSQRWSNDDDSYSHDTHTRDSKSDLNSDRKGSYDDHGFNEQPGEFNVRRSVKTFHTDEGDKRKDDSSKKEGKNKRELNLHRLAGYSPNPTTSDDGKKKFQSSFDTLDLDVVNTQEKTKDVETKEENQNQNEIPGDNQKDSQPEAAESSTESNDGTSIPLHLPKKQRELFLRIQQQQREADSSQDQSGDEEDNGGSQQEENWYSSDDEEDSLTNVLKNLSRQEETIDTKDSPPVSSFSVGMGATATSSAPTASNTITGAASEGTSSTAAAAGSFDKLKLSNLSFINLSESVSKLLSTIRQQNTEESATSVTTSSTERLSPTKQTNPSIARDPRLSRDPRNRGQTSPLVSSMTATPSEAAAVPSLASNAATSLNTLSSPPPYESGQGRRSDPRRVHDPRSSKSKNETSDSRHGGSTGTRRSSSATSAFTSIYSNAIMSDRPTSLGARLNLSGEIDVRGVSDVDLRNCLSRKDMESADIDLRQTNRSDLDLRTVQQSTPSVSYGDTDLRLKTQDFLGVGQLLDGRRSSSDVDFRRMLELPFKPVPMHTPATEIDASVTSHPPIPYKVCVITIPRPDYTSLKLNTADPQVYSDPRLRKIFKLDSTPSSPTKSSSLSSIASSRNDPRRQMTSRGGGSSSVSSVSGAAYTVQGNLNNPDFHDAQVPMMHNPFSDFNTMPTTSNIASKSSQDVLMLQNSMMMTNATVPGMLPNLGVSSQSQLLTNFDPRMSRNPRHAPGLLGPAPLPANYCPNTPLFEEQEDNSNGSDGDPRGYFGRGNPMEISVWEQQQQHSQRNSWRSRRNQQRYMEQDFNERSPS